MKMASMTGTDVHWARSGLLVAPLGTDGDGCELPSWVPRSYCPVMGPRYCRLPVSVAPMQQGARPAPHPSDEISDLDLKIIEELQGDGRRPYTQIAAQLGVSEAAVRARTNRLMERGRAADRRRGGSAEAGLRPDGVDRRGLRRRPAARGGQRDRPAARGHLRGRHGGRVRPPGRGRVSRQRVAARRSLPRSCARSMACGRRKRSSTYRIVKQSYHWGSP